MEKTLDKITIKKGQYKPKLTEKAKELKQEKRIARKAFEKASPSDKKEKLDSYVKAQMQLKIELDHMEKLMVEDRINKLVRAGGIKSDLFWKIRKQIINKSKNDEDYDLITEEGEVITDPELSKEFRATYFENLYQARGAAPGYEKWTEEIDKTVAEIEESMKDLPDEPEFNDLFF